MPTTTWVESSRAKAWELYKSAPLPDRVTHVWRYTDPLLFQISDELASVPPRAGLIRPAGDVPAGIEVRELEASGADGAAERLGTAVPATAGRLEALNLARWQGGLFVRVPKGRTAAGPLTLASELGADRFQASRLLVIAEPDAEATVILEYATGAPALTNDVAAGATAHVNGVIEVFAGANARVRLVIVQNLHAGARLHLAERTIAEHGARVETIVCSLGGAVTKADVGAILAGEGADSESWGVILGDGRQHFDHHTVHEHRAGRTRSNFDYKTVLRDRAHSVYTGLIRIDKAAANCEAYQENRNLMLSETAKADSIPELEILNNEVRCTHGATMGPIEPEYIFYLMARGIPRADAVRLIVEGFVDPIMARLPEGLRATLRAHFDRRLESLPVAAGVPAGGEVR